MPPALPHDRPRRALALDVARETPDTHHGRLPEPPSIELTRRRLAAYPLTLARQGGARLA